MLQLGQQPNQRSFDFHRLLRQALPTPGWVLREEAIMGTAIRCELWAEDTRAGIAACDAVMDEMRRIDRAMSPHKSESELSRINRDAGLRAVPLSEEMTQLLAQALRFSRATGGAFDISYAAAGQHYDYREGRAPDAATLAAARQAIGWQHLQLDVTARTLRFGRPGMRIDLGGFAKGHAVDRAAAIVQRRGIRHAYISAGGDSRVIGDRRGRPWSVAIRDPRGAAEEAIAVLPLEDVSVSTSGDYERFFVGRDGARVHHLIDPATGTSPQGVHSATVLAADGLTSEAMSKALFVLGPERGLALIEQMPGLDAVVVDASGQMHVSSGLLQGSAAH